MSSKGGGGMRERDEVRRAREEVEELEASRLRLSGDVMRGDPEALNEDRRLERRLWELTRWMMRAEQEEKDQSRAETERRGEELREAWRKHHPEEGHEKDRLSSAGPS